MEPIKADTFLEYQFPGRINFNPDGTRTALVCTTPDGSQNCYINTLMVWEGGKFRRLFQLDSSAVYVWDNDEEIVFTGELEEDHTALSG